MSTVIETPSTESSTSPAQRLQAEFVAAKVSFTWLGVRKSLNADQQAQAADTFDASSRYLSATKRLLDVKHPAFRAVTVVRGQAVGHWKSHSLPYPEPGLRLIKQAAIESFHERMLDYQRDLADAVETLDSQFDELKEGARHRLGTLYDPRDYPESLAGLFQMEWSFPTVEPPSYLQRLHPEIYQRQCSRVAAQFDEAVRLAEEAFTTEFENLLSHLVERLSGEQDGKPKVFRDTAVGNLRDFFKRFRSLNVRSNDQLDELIEQAQHAVTGMKPQDLRTDLSLREHVADQLQSVKSSLDEMLTDRPRRNIIRRPK
ncbi:MAG: hypothetical protein N2C14_19815 [Planctomycetales bacterium]